MKLLYDSFFRNSSVWGWTASSVVKSLNSFHFSLTLGEHSSLHSRFSHLKSQALFIIPESELVKLEDQRTEDCSLESPGTVCKTNGYTPSEATSLSLSMWSSFVSSTMAFVQRKYYSEANFVLGNNIQFKLNQQILKLRSFLNFQVQIVNSICLINKVGFYQKFTGTLIIKLFKTI